MDKPTPPKATSRTAVVAAMILTLGSLAGARTAFADPSGGGAPKKAAPATVHPAPPAPAEADDAYRCHPSEDVACTIIRETAQGTLIVTMRPGGASSAAPAWTVISGAPPTLGPHPGGTVYVVPNASPSSETASWAHEAALMPANGAPILE